MKNIIIVLICCVSGILSSQNPRSLSSSELPEEDRNFILSTEQFKSPELDAIFSEYEVFALPLSEITSFTSQQKSTFGISLQFGDNEVTTFELEPNLLWDGRTKVRISTQEGIQEQDMPRPTTYRGRLTTDMRSEVACSFSEGFCSGMVETETGAIYWEPVFRFISGVPHNWIVRYAGGAVKPYQSIKCAVADGLVLQDQMKKQQAEEKETFSGCFEMDIAQAADWSMWQKYGGATGVIDYMASVINQCVPNFDNEFSNQVGLRIAGVWLSSCSSCDPWSNTTQSDPLLVSFRDWGNGINNWNLPFDIGQLWTNRDMDGNTVGYAYIGVSCTSGFRYQWIQDWTTGSYLRCTVSHELGHNLNASHDPNGSGHIMNPSSNGSNTWSAASQNVINPFIQDRVNDGCFFPCTPFHFEYAKLTEEGYRFRDAWEIVETTTYLDCEPVWLNWSFNQVAGGVFVNGKTELVYPDGSKNEYIFSDGPAPSNGWIWLRYFQHYNQLSPGNYTWNLYQKASTGQYILVSSKTFNIIAGPSSLACSEKMHLPLNGNTNDISGTGNNATVQGGSITYDKDRFNNCNSALRISGGKYLEAPVINERSVSFWFKANQQEQMVIYDGGPGGFESKDWNVGIYKPNGLGGNSTFDNTFGLYFGTWDRDIAIPFDALKTGWHHVAISRDDSAYNRFRIMIDGQFPTGYLWDGFPTVQAWVPQNQPFELPSGGYGVPNLHTRSYKTYVGKDFENRKIWDTGLAYFDGWLDEVRVFGQLLNANEMTALYNAANDNPNNVNASSSQSSYCEGQTIQLNASASGATAYSWIGPLSFSSSLQNPVRSNATTAMGGTYTLTVTLAGGCTMTRTVSLTVNPKPSVSITSINACTGTNNGSAMATATGGSSFNYLWSNGQSGTNVSGLSSGLTYTVTVTNSSNCSSTASITIGTAATPTVSVTNSISACSGQNNGAATATVSGGVTPYQYLWSNGQTNISASNLAAGTYTVTVSGNNGCSATASATITTASSPLVSVSAIAACSSQNNGVATATVSGGVTPYQYLWSNGQTNISASNLTAGTYTVTVSGSNGCSTTASTTITTASSPVVSTSGIAACAGQNNGVATATVSGGVTPYQYSWSDGQTNISASNLTAGTYTITVSGSNGCSTTASATITTASSPVVSTSGIAACAGQNNGSATATVSGGVMPYQYSWSDGQTNISASNLTAGTYTVTVSGSNGCSSTATIIINELSSPIVSISATTGTCFGQSIGSVTVAVNGGNMPYQYIWSNGQTSATAFNLSAGTYVVTVTNAAGCTGTSSAIVIANPLPQPNITGILSICEGSSTMLDAGSGFVTYSWSTSATTQNITATQSGTYTVTVTTAQMCVGTNTATIEVYPLPQFQWTGDTVFCLNSNTNIGVSTTNDTYLWSNGQTSNAITISQAGNYSVTVTNSFGCERASSIDIIELAPSIVPIGSDALKALPDNANYQWYKNNQPISGATNQTYTIVGDGAYNVAVTIGGVTCFSELLMVTAVEEPERSTQVLIFPNPTNGILNLESEEEIKVLSLYDILGNLLLGPSSINQRKYLVDMTQFTKGEYLLLIAFQGKTLLRKVIKS